MALSRNPKSLPAHIKTMPSLLTLITTVSTEERVHTRTHGDGLFFVLSHHTLLYVVRTRHTPLQYHNDNDNDSFIYHTCFYHVSHMHSLIFNYHDQFSEFVPPRNTEVQMNGILD